MNTVLLAALIAHLVLCVAGTLLIALRASKVPAIYLPLLYCVPLFGFVGALWMGRIYARNQDGREYAAEQEEFVRSVPDRLGVDESDQPVVPLEEAILINDMQTRRAVMIDILRRNPQNYLDLLKVARLNDDVEVSHYATTTIVEIQREYELAIARLSAYLRESPDNIRTMDRYIETLGKYIASGLLDEHLLRQQRMHYAWLQRRRIKLRPNDRAPYALAVENDVALRMFDRAEELFLKMLALWPHEETVWFAGLRLFAESGEAQKKDRLLETALSVPVDWSAKGREQMRFWCGEDVFERRSGALKGIRP